MQDYRYKFLDQAEMLSLLEPLGMTYTDDDGIHVSQGGHQYATWYIGEIEGVDGVYLNLRLIDMEMDVSSLDPYIVTPANPKYTWA